jgi:hypothetical protein
MDQNRPIGLYSNLVGDLEAIEADAAAIMDQLASTRQTMKELAAALGITLPEVVAS